MFELNEILTTKKNHACGSNVWTVVRVGADYKIKCNQCGRIICIDLEKLKKMIKPTKKQL